MPKSPIPYTGLEKRARGYIRARIPREDAEDVIQDAWLRIVKDWPNYDPKKGPPWPFAKYRCQSAIAEYYRRRRFDQSEENFDPSATPNPSPAEYAWLLEVTFAAPGELHQLIVFAYLQLLEWRRADVVAILSDQALEDLGNRFVVEYSSRFPHHRNLILDLLQPFTERLRGERDLLTDRFDDPDDEKRRVEVSRWRHSVLRHVRSDFLFLQALEVLFTSSRQRHQQIVQGLVALLRWTPQGLAKKHCHKSLKSLAEQLEAGCCSKRQHLRRLVQRIFRPLHRDPPLTDQTLCDLVPEGRNPADEFALWCQSSEGREP